MGYRSMINMATILNKKLTDQQQFEEVIYRQQLMMSWGHSLDKIKSKDQPMDPNKKTFSREE